MQIGDIDDLRSFVGIVDHGGLTAAVAALGTTKSTLSRKLAGLETPLGSRLIDRNAHSFRLTDAGMTVYEYATRILAEVDRLEDAMQPSDPAGLLRVTTTYGLAMTALGPVLPEFLLQFPEIDIDLEASSQRRDLSREDFDVAVRAGELSGGALIARRLGKADIGLFASPAYLASVGETERSLSTHPTIGLNRDNRRPYALEGSKTTNVQPRSRLWFNDPLLIKSQLIAGLGSGWLPLHLAHVDVTAGRLVRCKPEHTLTGPEVFALFPSRKDIPMKTRVFIDFLAERLRFEEAVVRNAIDHQICPKCSFSIMHWRRIRCGCSTRVLAKQSGGLRGAHRLFSHRDVPRRDQSWVDLGQNRTMPSQARATAMASVSVSASRGTGRWPRFFAWRFVSRRTAIALNGRQPSEASFKPMTPQTISISDTARIVFWVSPKNMTPMRNVPAAPMPVQTA